MQLSLSIYIIDVRLTLPPGLTMATDAAGIVENAPSDKASTPTASTAPTTPSPAEDSAALNLDVKFVNSRYKVKDPCGWEYEDTRDGGDVPAELVQPLGIDVSEDSWTKYCFVVVRRYPTPEQQARGIRQIVFEIVVKSEYLLKACEDVIGGGNGISWSSPPVTVRTYHVLLAVFCSCAYFWMAIAQPEALDHVLPEI